jgi:hypothetical protein
VTSENEKVFTRIYDSQLWGDGSSENPLSGGGSNPDLTVKYVEFVKSVVEEYDVSSIVDVGHGDWMMWRDYKFENVNYLGLDVALGLSEKLTEMYGSATRKFVNHSSTNFDYPPADLLISKEVFQHLPVQDLMNFLRAAENYGYVILCNGYYPLYLLPFRLRNILKLRTRITRLKSGLSPFSRETFPRNNSEISAGEFRGLNLTRKPFRKAIEKFHIIHTFDFGGHKKFGVVSRVYFLRRK